MAAGIVALPAHASVPAAMPMPAPAATTSPFLDDKWNGTSDTDDVTHTGCNYAAIKQSHSGIGWHFVLGGDNADLSAFTANFEDDGEITVTTTETASGVIVQGGKGAVIYTSSHDTLEGLAKWNDANGNHAGKGTNATATSHYLQLSHICTGTTSSPSPSPSESESESPSPDPSESDDPSVEPTDLENDPSSEPTDDTEVEGVTHQKPNKPNNKPQVAAEQQQLPFTGSDMDRSIMLALALLVIGLMLFLSPTWYHEWQQRPRRRH